MKRLLPWLAVTLTACTAMNPPRDASTSNRIADELKQAATPKPKETAALPPSIRNSLLPPLRMRMPKASSRQLEQRFDLVLNEAPINQALMGIVSDTPYSILLKPRTLSPAAPSAAGGVPVTAASGTPENVTVNLKDVTVFEALDAIRELYGYDYTVDGKRIYVQPPELQTRLYQLNYIIGQRRGVSDLQVIAGASVGSSSSSGSSSGGSTGSNGAGGAGSSYASVQASALSTQAKSDLWGEIEDTLRTTLGCQIPKNLPGRTGGAGLASGAPGGGAASNSSNAGGAAGRADVSYQGDMQSGERLRGMDGCPDGRAMTINPMSGTILVRGMPTELRLVGKLLRSMQISIERQVIIEAKIIDVELNSQSQQGINWSVFSHGLHRFSVGANTASITEPGGGGGSTLVGDTTFTTGPGGTTASATVSPQSLGQVLGTGLLGSAAGSAFSVGLGAAVQLRNFSALLNFLETQGEVHVLSSPRIATLNNQKAVLKVGTEEPFVSSISPQQVQAGVSLSNIVSANLNYQPFFSGVALDVTPQIDERDNITLHVHAMVNSIVEKQKIAQPSANSVTVPFAVNTINETDSVVKTRDGQVIVIGGLMTEKSTDDRAKIPGAGDAPVMGALFHKGAQSLSKRELVILLKPTVVKDDDAWEDDIAGVQGRIERLSARAGDPVRPAGQ